MTWSSTIYVVACVVAPLCSDHYYGNVRAHTLLDEEEHDPEHRVFAVGAKEHDSEHRRGVCCRGNKTVHRRYRREAIRRYAPGYGRSVLRAIRCTSCRASWSRSLSSYYTPQYGTRGRTPGPRRSYCSIPSQRWYLLETVEARLHGEGL